VPLAWFAMGLPAREAAHAALGERSTPARRITLGAAALTAWDLFLDPQMVEAGHWVWDNPDPGLPGVDGIPLTNYAGWLLASTVMMLVMTAVSALAERRRTLPSPGRLPHDLVPAGVLAWTYASQVLANVVFFGRPAVAAWGGLLMGLAVIPYLRLLLAERRTPQ